MKKLKLFVSLLFISFAFSLFAQTPTLNKPNKESKWTMGVSSTIMTYSFRSTSSSAFSSTKMKGNTAAIGAFVSRKVFKNLEIGLGYGGMNLTYTLTPDKSLHRLDQTINYNDRPDFSKKPYVLEEVTHRNKYQNVQTFVKLNLSKNRRKVFQPSLGLRMDNYWLQNANTTVDFKGGNDDNFGGRLLGSLILSVVAGEIIYIDGPDGPSWDAPTGRQRRETEEFYSSQNSKHFMTLSPSVDFAFNFSRVSFGFEPYFSISPKKINKSFKDQSLYGMRAYFGFRF